MTTYTFATQVTAYYLAAIAAFEAGGPALNIAGGTLVVGDGDVGLTGTPVVPTISALIAANGVTHSKWSGATIDAVVVDPDNADQLDIQVHVPAAVGGVEVGPFTITEFAILDALGNCCLVGNTYIVKAVSGMGMITSPTWIAATVYSVAGSVTITPPSAGFVTAAMLAAAIAAAKPRTLHVQRVRTGSAAPGALPFATWTRWPLNTVALNEISGASLNTSTGQITLPAGKYRASFVAQCRSGGSHHCRLRDITNGVDLGTGNRGDSYVGPVTDSNPTTNPSIGDAVFTLAGTTVIELDHINSESDTSATLGDVGSGTFNDAYVMLETR